MQIEFTNEQYRKMMELVSLGNGAIGILGEALPDSDYPQRSDEGEELQGYLLQFASQFDSEDLLKDEAYQEYILPIMMDYEEYISYDNLISEMAWRDMHRELSDDEISELIDKYEDQFEKKIDAYEDKYRKEVSEYGITRLEVVPQDEAVVNTEELVEEGTEERAMAAEEWVDEGTKEEK